MDVWIKSQLDELMDQCQMGGKIDQWVDEFSHFTKTVTYKYWWPFWWAFKI